MEIPRAYLQCRICLKDFIEPRILRCGHVFCCLCLKSIRSPADVLQCPICRKETTLGQQEMIEDLIEPAFLKVLLHLAEDPNSNNLCRSCSSLDRVVVTHYCYQCKARFCERCVRKYHNKSLKHKSDKLDKVRFCFTHPNEVEDEFCRQCDVITCHLCIDTYHTSHQPVENVIDVMTYLRADAEEIIDSQANRVLDEKCIFGFNSSLVGIRDATIQHTSRFSCELKKIKHLLKNTVNDVTTSNVLHTEELFRVVSRFKVQKALAGKAKAALHDRPVSVKAIDTVESLVKSGEILDLKLPVTLEICYPSILTAMKTLTCTLNKITADFESDLRQITGWMSPTDDPCKFVFSVTRETGTDGFSASTLQDTPDAQVQIAGPSIKRKTSGSKKKSSAKLPAKNGRGKKIKLKEPGEE